MVNQPVHWIDKAKSWAAGYSDGLRDAEKVLLKLCGSARKFDHFELAQKLQEMTPEVSGDNPYASGYHTAMTELIEACGNAIENGHLIAYDTDFQQVIQDRRAERGLTVDGE